MTDVAQPSPYEESGIVRTTVFPNNIRGWRMLRGEYSLLGMLQNPKVVCSITYTRWAKLERGETFPKAQELIEIGRVLNVPIECLLIRNDPDLDVELWARDGVEASLLHRGGGLDAMYFGAMLRMERLEAQLSMEQVDRQYGIPVSMLSRIENAFYPLERIETKIKKRLTKYMIAGNWRHLLAISKKHANAGRLDPMMLRLFGKEHLARRRKLALEGLVYELAQLGALELQYKEAA